MHHVLYFVCWVVSLSVQVPMEDPNHPYAPIIKTEVRKQFGYKAFDKKEEADKFLKAAPADIQKRMKLVELED